MTHILWKNRRIITSQCAKIPSTFRSRENFKPLRWKIVRFGFVYLLRRCKHRLEAKMCPIPAFSYRDCRSRRNEMTPIGQVRQITWPNQHCPWKLQMLPKRDSYRRLKSVSIRGESAGHQTQTSFSLAMLNVVTSCIDDLRLRLNHFDHVRK